MCVIMGWLGYTPCHVTKKKCTINLVTYVAVRML